MRKSQSNHLWSFKNYADAANVFYVNFTFGGSFGYLKKIDFDLIIFDWSFVGMRNDRKRFIEILEKLSYFKNHPATKVCLPQDEFTSMDILCDFINKFNLSYVYSVAPKSEWCKIYRTADKAKVNFVSVLTGYLDETVVKNWSLQEVQNEDREIDIGYRTVASAIWGRFNLMKAKIAEVFLQEASQKGLRVDICVGEEHFLLGDDWLKFLSRCRFTLGIEGGSRILDWDGSIAECVRRNLEVRPNLSFDELTRACVPLEREGEINVVALSPRHLEACLTRTAQILVEGEYNGVLKPHVHYIPVKADFSNLKEVFCLVQNEPYRLKLVASAYKDIVASGQYTYRMMVHTIIDRIDFPTSSQGSKPMVVSSSILLFINRCHTVLNLSFVWLWSCLRRVKNVVFRAKSKTSK